MLGIAGHQTLDEPAHLYNATALWPQTPHLPRKVRVAIDTLAAELPRLMA